MTGPWIVALVAVASLSLVTAVLVLGLLRRMTVLLQSVEGQLQSGDGLGGVPVGGAVPSFEVVNQVGHVLSSSDLMAGPGILLLLAQDCAPCESLIDEMVYLGRSPTRVPLVAIAQLHEDVAVVPLSGIVDSFRDVTAFEKMSISATPFAMAFDSRGIVVSRTVPNSIKSLRELETALNQEVTQSQQASRWLVGGEAGLERGGL